ncbi:hypothetical protein [Streptomyces sp. NBC_00091]|uniref:hypothetical protein n=1 Tax=Streptomyces sp. NBC_00091 TaxID=2975648 RepID=UPI0022511A35|nr:hypothetical protein [Streptomyces sp. NBC_00091]MCX5378547.1 hypothetical protein [Streptomyces sp. NBC_00091]
MSPTRTRNRRRLTGVAAATLVVAAVTPATLASAAPSATVSPGTVAPGSRVSLNLDGCGTTTGRASSRAFGDVSLSPGNREATNLFGAATVYRDATAGSYPVTFECGGSGGRRVTVTLQVTPGAARGGLGGSVESMSPGQIALGGTLAAGALGTGIWLLRRRWAHTG